ncbi:MAG: type III-B CRISPR-associated protein Cas10/Cmr2 [Anaerolineales bacterium]|nr:type III-B CRISPR-associated protein Cas10/Cmr2 [Anaerolineales bacterium]
MCLLSFRLGQHQPEQLRKLYKNYRARQGEWLSGVDLLKRLGKLKDDLEPKFKSTSHIAALPYLVKVHPDHKEGEDYPILNEIRTVFEKATWKIGEEEDGALLYEGRITEWVSGEEAQKELRKALNSILDNYEKKLRPSPYYALLLADGDNMGKTIDAQKKPDEHQRLSRKLSQFAIAVPEVVRKYQGVCVYAGGDDILAYLPLHTVLECGAELETKFKSQMEVFTTIDHLSPTLSAGIVIAHHLTPLSDVLEMARQAEKEAKSFEGKNALAITLSKRGGVARTITDKWDALYQRVTRLSTLSRQGAISAGTAYELQELERFFSRTTIPIQGKIDEAIRIIKRKRESGGEKKINDKIQQDFEKWLTNGISPGRLAYEMIIAQTFGSAADMASIPLPIDQEASQ